MNYAISTLENSNILCLDVETTGLEWWNDDRILGFSFAGNETREAFYLPLRHRDNPERNVPLSYAFKLKNWLLDPTKWLLGHNIKFDTHFLETDYLYVKNTHIDTMLLAHLVNENNKPFSLEYQSQYWLDLEEEEKKGYPALVEEATRLGLFKGKNLAKMAPLTKRRIVYSNLDIMDMEIVAKYCIIDNKLPFKLFDRLMVEIKKCGPKFCKVAQELGMYSNAITRMEWNGIPIDLELTKKELAYAQFKKKDLQATLEMISGKYGINPASHDQVRELLYGIPKEEYKKQKEKTGIALSTNRAMLTELMEEDEEDLDEDTGYYAALVNDYRQYHKAETTYYKRMIEMADRNSRNHPSLLIHGTAAGRLAARDWNITAIPRVLKGMKSIYKVKNCIVAPEGWLFLTNDFEQIELRFAAHYSNCPTMIEAYHKGEDLHRLTASIIFNKPIEEVTDFERYSSKSTNFGFLYSMGALKFQTYAKSNYGIKVTLEQAQKYREAYFNKYPELKTVFYKAQNFASINGYIEMWTGRRRHYQNKEDCKDALNNLIQGSAAELMRTCILRIDQWLEEEKYNMENVPKIISQVHDDLVLEIYDDNMKDYWIAGVRSRMTDFNQFRVPITVETKIGKTLADMKVVSL